MWLPRGGRAPVNFEFPLLQYLLQLLFPQNLLLWKQKSRFNADPSPCSSFTLQTKLCVTGVSGSEPVGKHVLSAESQPKLFLLLLVPLPENDTVARV